MSDTPRTDALREVVIRQYLEDELTGNGMGNLLAALTDIGALERERDAVRERADTMFAKHAEILDQYRRERDAERALADRLADALVATLRGNLAKMEIPIHLTRLRQRFRTILMEGGTQ